MEKIAFLARRGISPALPAPANSAMQGNEAAYSRQKVVAMDSKLEWLSRRLRCPSCSSVGFVFEPTPACRACGTPTPVIDGALSFITEELMATCRIEPNAKPSEHPYNPTALEIIAAVGATGGMVLDCGAGQRQFTAENLIQTEIMAYTNIDVLAVNQDLPFADDSFDAVFSFDVLEHVTDPFSSARELARVLKPGGILYIDLPFLQHEHGYPHHYFNATRMGLRQLFDGRLKPEIHVVPSSGHPSFVIWSLLSNYRAGLPKDRRAEFEQMTIGEMLKQPWKEFRDGPMGKISDEILWKMPSATQAIFSKDGPSIIDLDIPNLPAFRGKALFTS
jgi:SAM-dependent methyltransferase